VTVGRRGTTVAARTTLEPNAIPGPGHVPPEVWNGRDAVEAAAAVWTKMTVDVVVDE